MSQPQSHRGLLVARTLLGSWRPSNPTDAGLTEPELDEVTPLLYGAGAAALGWWRIRNSDLRTTASAQILQQVFRLQVLQESLHEAKVMKVFGLLRDATVDPILVKGWAASQLYQQPGLRPYGDIDLLIRRPQYQLARTVLDSPEARDCWVDLHLGFTEVKDRSQEQLFKRSRMAQLGNQQVRILAAEDHLALLAIHFLKHGGWRPLWLCDIAAAIEALPSEFDWNMCLGSDPTRTRWITSVIGLAHRLLGANIQSIPFAVQANELPPWLVSSVLKQWENPFPTNQPPLNHPIPMVRHLKNPSGFLKGLQARWPNPILATVSVNGEFNNFPRLPYQLANWVMRMVRLVSPTGEV